MLELSTKGKPKAETFCLRQAGNQHTLNKSGTFVMMKEFEKELSRLNRAGGKQFGDDWIPCLEQRKSKLESAYLNLWQTGRDPIPYSSLSARTAYLFAYAPARAEYTRQYLGRHRTAWGQPLFEKASIEVVSFGGGPASELVGLVRYLECPEHGEPVLKINYVVHDKDEAWADTATRVIAGMETDIAINVSYEKTDVASRRSMGRIDLSQTDFVMFSYIMSELAKVGKKDVIAENFRNILAKLEIGAKGLFIDNLHPIFINYFYSWKLVSGLSERNDDDAPVPCDFSEMIGVFKELSDTLMWIPRTELRSVSKLIVRVNK